MQHGYNVYIFIQHETRGRLTVHYGSESNQTLFGNIATKLTFESSHRNISKNREHYESTQFGWFISWIFKLFYSSKGPTVSLPRDLCPKGPRGKGTKISFAKIIVEKFTFIEKSTFIPLSKVYTTLRL